MLGTIIAGVVTYWSTAIDLLIILMLFFAKVKDKKGVRDIYIGQFLGSGLLILVSLFFAVILHYVPDKRLLGFLGIIPVFLGIKALILGDSDGEKMANEKYWDIDDILMEEEIVSIKCNCNQKRYISHLPDQRGALPKRIGLYAWGPVYGR